MKRFRSRGGVRGYPDLSLWNSVLALTEDWDRLLSLMKLFSAALCLALEYLELDLV